MNTRPWQDINLPFNPFEAKNEKLDAADRKKQDQDQEKADAESERDAYNKKFKPELTDPAWSHASESRAGESPDSALAGDTLLLSAKSKDIVAGAAVRCFIRDFAASAPWLTERKLSARVGNDDSVQVEWVIDKNKDDTENPDFKFWFEIRKADSTVEASTAQTPIPLGKAQSVDYIEIPDILFNKGSALPLPGESWQLAGALALVVAHAKEAAGSSLLVCGHASDSDEGICSTLEISKWRSVAIKALLDNDENAWLDVAHDFSCSKDIQQFLVAVSSLWGDDCHPGDVDGVIGPKSKAAIRNYKKHFNKNAKGNLADSETIDDAFLQSMVALYREVILDQYKQSTGETSLPGVTWAHDGKGIYSCGTSFKPEEGATSKSGARVELFFITDTVKAVITDPSDPESPPSSAEIPIYGTGFTRTLIAPVKGSLSKRMSVDFIEIADIHFNHNCALPCLDSKGELIGLLAQAFDYAKKHPERKCIVEGHADTSGDPEYNLAISKRRAESIKALLSGEISLWNAVAACSDHKIETEDYQATLKGLAEKYSWPCDPGAVDNKNGPKTEAAVKGFQTEYNKRFSKELKVDGSVGPKTWEAIGLTIRSLLEDHLKNNLKLDPIPEIAYGYPDGKGIYPCGESCPIENAGDTDYKSAENRRVELVFYKKGDPEPAVPPAAGRDIGIIKDPVSEKEWGKAAIPLQISPSPAEKPVQIKGKLFWNRTWDYMDETKPIAAIKEFLPGAKAVLEIKKDDTTDFKAYGETYLSDDVDKALVTPHTNAGEFVFNNVPKSKAARIKILLEYKDNKIVCVKGKTIKGNTKFKDEPDFKIHTGKTVEHTTPISIDKINWTQDRNDLGEIEITKALFVDICDAYKSVWTGNKRLKEMAEYEAEICQINFPEDPAISVSNAGLQMQLCQDDLKDRAVILHEYGHFIGTNILGGLTHPGYGYNDDLTNSHSPTSKEHYESAWNEGHATFLSCALTDNPHYHDGYDTTLDMHLDTDNTKVGPHCEGSIQEALWRIYKVHNIDFKKGFWKAFTDRTKRTCRTIFDFFDNWEDLKLDSLDKAKESFKLFNMEYGYKYLDGANRFKNIAKPKAYDESKKEFVTLAELHTHKGSAGGGNTADYNEEFYNRNKHFNSGSLKAKSTIAAPKTNVGTSYIIPERFTISV